MKKLKVGIIGAGRIGKLHAQNIMQHIPNMSLQAISDPALDKEWVKTWKIPYGAEQAEKILQDASIEAVLICSPAPTHAPLIIEAAKKGKHIFCEKPLSLDVAEIKKALAAVDAAGVKLQVGFNRRFDPNFAKVKETVQSGKVGAPHLLRITSYDPEPPPLEYVKNSGGIFLDMSIHDFDMARFLSGSEVTEVFAMGATLINPEFKKYDDVDTAIVQLRFANGALGVIDNSRKSVYGYDQRVEVFGSLGSIAADNNTPTRTVCYTEQGVTSDKPLRFFLDRYQESYRAELLSFCDSILDDKPCAVDGHDGLMPVIIGLAAKQSLRENRPIRIEN